MKEKILKKIPKSLNIFLATFDKVEKHAEVMQSNSSDTCIHLFYVEIFNTFDPELKLINAKAMIKSKLKELLSELKSLRFSRY